MPPLEFHPELELDPNRRLQMEAAQKVYGQQQLAEQAQTSKAQEQVNQAQQAMLPATAAMDIGVSMNNDLYKGKGWNEQPAEFKQRLYTSYPAIADKMPGMVNALARNESGNPMAGTAVPQDSEMIVSTDSNGETRGSTRASVRKAQVAAPASLISSDLEGQGALDALPDNFKILAKQVADGKVDIKALSRYGGVTNQILAAASQIRKNYSTSDYVAQTASRKDFTSGAASRDLVSLRALLNHTGALLDKHPSLGNSQAPIFNKPYNAVRDAFGNPDIGSYETAAQSVAEEMAKFMSGGQSSESQRKEWEDKFSSSRGPDQIKNTAKEVLNLLAGKVHALSEKYNAAYMSPRDFSFIDQPTQALLKKHGLDPALLDPVIKQLDKLKGEGFKPGEMPTRQPGEILEGDSSQPSTQVPIQEEKQQEEKPRQRRQGGVIYTLQPDGSYR